MAQSIVERGEIPPVKAKISRQMRWWGSKPPAWGLLGFGGAVALLMLIPLAYIVVRASTANAETWESLWSRRIPMLLTNTLSLTAVVTLGSVVLGVTLAWLTTRTDLPGRAWLDWLIAMPLAVPPYVGALCYITAFDHSGLAEQFTGGLYDLKLGERAWVYGFWGAAIILILYTYPYVYLNVAAALRNSNRNLEEAARSLGKSGWRFFWRVQLPLLRPAISAGALVTAFYMLSEFGVVSLLRYETFTVTIFRQLGARNDNNAAAILSGVLIVMTLLILWGENRAHRSQSRYWQISGQWKPARPQTLGIWKFPALGLVGLVLTAALWLPLLVLFYWLIREVSTTPPNWERLWEFSFNSLWSGALAATLSVILSLPLAYLAARYSGIFGRWLPRLATAGNALPGVVVALSMIFLFNNWLPALYGTLVVLIVAYIVRFLPLTLQASRAAISQTSDNLEDAGHSLGLGKFGVLRRVVLPLIRPGMIAGWTIFFLTVVRELPATLALRPIGFDTLPVRVWFDASEGLYGRAALPALLLIGLAAVPLYLILTRRKQDTHLLG